MTIHTELRAAIIRSARAAKPGLTDPEVEAIVTRVASSPTIAPVADFLSDDLRFRAGTFSDFESIVRVFALSNAAPAATPPDARDGVPAEVWNRMSPREKLARHYTAEASERTDVEAQALAERAERAGAKPHDVLAHHRATTAPPTKAERKAAETPKVRTDDLANIVDPAKRHEEWRRRVAASKSRQTLELERSALERRALDAKTDPATRAAANTELTRVVDALAKIGA
jgi:hypothetical protein